MVSPKTVSCGFCSKKKEGAEEEEEEEPEEGEVKVTCYFLKFSTSPLALPRRRLSVAFFNSQQ